MVWRGLDVEILTKLSQYILAWKDQQNPHRNANQGADHKSACQTNRWKLNNIFEGMSTSGQHQLCFYI